MPYPEINIRNIMTVDFFAKAINLVIKNLTLENITKEDKEKQKNKSTKVLEE